MASTVWIRSWARAAWGVYRAFHLHLQRPCAIRFMHPQLVSNPELRTRFAEKPRVPFSLGTPISSPSPTSATIPPLAVPGDGAGVGRDPARPPGARPLPHASPSTSWSSFRRASTLRIARVIHRDLKPENLFWSASKRLVLTSSTPRSRSSTLGCRSSSMASRSPAPDACSVRLRTCRRNRRAAIAPGRCGPISSRSAHCFYECLVGEKNVQRRKLERSDSRSWRPSCRPLTSPVRAFRLSMTSSAEPARDVLRIVTRRQ